MVYAIEVFDGSIFAGGVFPNFLASFPLNSSAVHDERAASPGPAIVAVTPNPLNPQTRIHFNLIESAQVDLTILDSRGFHVAQLHSSVLPAGEHNIGWDGRDGRGRRVASGVYLVKLAAGGQVTSAKVAVLR